MNQKSNMLAAGLAIALCASSYAGNWYARNSTDFYYFEEAEPWGYFQAMDPSNQLTYFNYHQSQTGHDDTLGGLKAQGWEVY
jgi:hypothetical protein